MATTQAQRASLFHTLAELMGTEDAETLVQQLPPGSWDSMATKDDLQVLAATFTAALAEFRVEFTNALAETRIEVTNALAEAAKERAEIIKAFSESHSELVRNHAELVKSQAELVESRSKDHSELVRNHAELVKSQAELVKGNAELIKSHARHLYITVSTIALATISIWIALFVSPTGG